MTFAAYRDAGNVCPRLPFLIGVQWHPEFRITEGDRNLFKALVAAASQ